MTRKDQPHQPKPINIFLLGTPGAGKATQSAILAKKFRLYDLDMGLEQLKQRKLDPELDKIYQKTVDVGKMSPTRVYKRLVENVLKTIPAHTGILFDGHPKMPVEVRFVARLLKKYGRTKCVCVYLDIPWSETVKRNLARKGYRSGLKRPDDSLSAIRVRFHNARHWVKLSKPVYKKLFPLASVSGLGSVTNVAGRIDKALIKLFKTFDEKGDGKN
jgi:adenylate kinase